MTHKLTRRVATVFATAGASSAGVLAGCRFGLPWSQERSAPPVRAGRTPVRHDGACSGRVWPAVVCSRSPEARR